jgi:plastocyanin
MRHFARARSGAVRGLTVLTFAGFAFAGFAFPGPAASASTTTTVVINFGATGACGSGVYFCYVPSPATVSAGDTVVWTDQSGFGPHTVTRCDPAHCAGHDGGTGTDSPLDGTVGPGSDFSHTFTGPGTYLYYCKIHGYALMNGIVTVDASGPTTTASTIATTTTTASTSSSTTPTTATPTSTRSLTATTLSTSAASTQTAAASGESAVDPSSSQSSLARTGRDLGLVYVGAAALGAGVVLVSVGQRTRRKAR